MRHFPVLVLILALTLPAASAAQSTMQIHHGTMFAGGQIAFQSHDLDFPSPTPDGSVKTVTFEPQFGWFFKSYLAAVAGVGYQSISGDTTELDRFSVSGGVRLYQPLALLHLYAGIEGAFHFTSYEQGDADTLDFALSAPVGVLIPLSRNVALDVGLRFTKIWRDNDHPAGLNYHSFIVDVGYLGVQAFF